MKPFLYLILIVLSWLVLSPFICHADDLGRNHSNHIQCIDTERDALLQFKHGITNDTCGLLTSWGSHTDCCRWTGVVCSDQTSHVVKLSLVGCDVGWLEGKVSPSLDDIGSLSSLRELYLAGNLLKGQLTLGVGQLTMLEILDVSSTSLEDTLTHTFFLSLVRLRVLILQDNPGLVISIEEDQIPPFKLDVILLRSCKLGPRFPKWLLLQTNFSYFDVSNTGISDIIPVSFWNTLSTNLINLNMSNNQLYGMLPNLPQKHKPFFSNPLTLIDLSSNLFEGVVPSSFANTGNLFLNDNKFSNCSNFLCPKTESMLIDLDLSYNLFSGELPDCWMNFYQLRSLHLENNRFSGSMPKSISTLSGLEYLYLYNNSFSGPFPIAFESLTSLKFLNLGFNSFGGNIPSWIGNSFQRLGALILRGNHFVGEIPESICQLKNLQILDLAINHLSGVLPYCIGNFTLLKGTKNLEWGYYLDELNIQTPLRGFEIESRSSETVIVSWKRQEQSFKETIIYVKYIDLSSNELSGEIPNGISSLTALGALDLSKNNLSGYIPLEIGNMTALEFLDLSNNHLSGEIPISLAKVTTLDVMNVSNNNLSGEIPVSTQLQSFDASSYAGNAGLCGAPLPSCSKDQVPSNVPKGDITSVQNKDDDFDFFLGLYISVVLGLIVGFWGVCGTLVIKTSWRYAYFRFLDNIKDKII
ncbi:receptor-like protein EIX2 [Silene latifolia]|uniref:receptor-like protein EIX2 n=1 Tax=Silene latifolia TaxID=37657 RepID=UPI003D77D7A0